MGNVVLKKIESKNIYLTFSKKFYFIRLVCSKLLEFTFSSAFELWIFLYDTLMLQEEDSDCFVFHKHLRIFSILQVLYLKNTFYLF